MSHAVVQSIRPATRFVHGTTSYKPHIATNLLLVTEQIPPHSRNKTTTAHALTLSQPRLHPAPCPPLPLTAPGPSPASPSPTYHSGPFPALTAPRSRQKFYTRKFPGDKTWKIDSKNIHSAYADVCSQLSRTKRSVYRPRHRVT